MMDLKFFYICIYIAIVTKHCLNKHCMKDMVQKLQYSDLSDTGKFNTL